MVCFLGLSHYSLSEVNQAVVRHVSVNDQILHEDGSAIRWPDVYMIVLQGLPDPLNGGFNATVN